MNVSLHPFPFSTPDNADTKESCVTNNSVNIPHVFLKDSRVHRQISAWVAGQTFPVGLFHF